MSKCPTRADIKLLASGGLSEADNAAVRAHLDECDDCRNYAEILGKIDSPRNAEADSPGEITLPDTHGSSAPALTPPTERMRRHFPKIEGYRIVGVLGQGGMGIVYQAVQTKLERTVALKVLPAIVGSANPAAVARFRREATAAARLHHTNIVPIYDFGESSEAYYYAMELITGQPLNVIIREFGKLKVAASSHTRLAEVMRTTILGEPEEALGDWKERSAGSDPPTRIGTSSSGKGQAYYHQVARWMSDAAEALHYAHDAGIIHRDIKPANLIVSTDGRIMVADFGLAKEIAEESVTMTGSLLGTLRYVSPEQAMAKRVRVDHRTDIYSLGATMYELLCFQPAFGGSDEKEILGQIISQDPVQPRKIQHSVPPELETICLKCMEKSKEARYDTARALSEDLRRYIHDLPIAAKRPGLARRCAKYIRRHRALVTALTAAILIAAASWYGVRQDAQRREEESLRLSAEADRRNAEVQGLYESGTAFAYKLRYKNAEEEWNKALAIDPDHVPTLIGLLWMNASAVSGLPDEQKEHALEEVVRLGQQVLEIDPTNVEALTYLGVALRRLQRYDEAIFVMMRSIKLEPQKYASWSNLGSLHAVTGDWEQAAKYLAEGAQRAGDAKDEWSAAAWRNLASFELFRRSDDAVEHVARAIKCHTTDTMSWVIRARVHMELDGHIDLREALGDAEYADRNADGANPKAKRIRALALLRNGEFELAVKHANLALELGDFATINHLIIAIAHARLGEVEESRRSFYRAEDAWPENLRNDGDVRATAEDGVLWFDTAAELLSLKAQAEQLLTGRP